ncbi:MAG: alpha/beta fold hydrolase [Chloroflexi bacterium]|nr:alpha/beta fold hydrolase [Chloroflexota bacterium]
MTPSWLNKELYPFTPKEFSLPMGKMSYVDEGTGEAIVMIHGNPSWSFEFRDLIKYFSKSHRCIAPDHIGFGLSDKPTDWDYLPKHQAENLERFLESLDLENITLIVGDWGGPIGLSYAIKHPDRIKNIIITNTWMWSAKDDWYYQAFSGFVGGSIGRWLIKKYNFFVRTVLKSIYGDKRKLTPEIHQHFIMPLVKPEERKGNQVLPKEIIASSDWLADLWKKRNNLNGKIKLIAWGMKDIAFRKKELNHWRKHFPDVKVVQYPDAGHFLAEEKSEELIAEMEVILSN